MTARPTKRLNATEELFAFHCRARKLPPPLREFRFNNPRKWRFDFAWPELLLAVEIEGLVVRKVEGRMQVSGRHATIDGMRGDMEKYNTAAITGWCVLRFEQTMVKSGVAIEVCRLAVESRRRYVQTSSAGLLAGLQSAGL